MSFLEGAQEAALRAAFAPLRPSIKKFINKRQLVPTYTDDGGLLLRIGIQDDKLPGRATGHIYLTGHPKEIAERYLLEAKRPEPEKPEPSEAEPEEAEGEEENDDEEGSSD